MLPTGITHARMKVEKEAEHAHEHQCIHTHIASTGCHSSMQAQKYPGNSIHIQTHSLTHKHPYIPPQHPQKPAHTHTHNRTHIFIGGCTWKLHRQRAVSTQTPHQSTAQLTHPPNTSWMMTMHALFLASTIASTGMEGESIPLLNWSAISWLRFT